MDPPPGVPGVSKDAPGSTKHAIFEIWCANIAPKLKNIGNTLRKQGFLTFFFNFDSFLKFVPFWGNISAPNLKWHV